MKIDEIKKEMIDLKDGKATYQTVSTFADLITVYKYLCEDEDPESMDMSEDTGVLPTYAVYKTEKRKYQLGEVTKERVLKSFDVFIREIKDFIGDLYRYSDMPEEREKINKMVNEIGVGNL